VRRYHARFIEALKLERSSPYLCSGAFITFISKPHDDVPELTPRLSLSALALRSLVLFICPNSRLEQDAKCASAALYSPCSGTVVAGIMRI